MNLERYPVKASPSKKRIEFISKGPMGNIKKVVEFQKIRLNYFNLAFGDWDKKKKTIDSKIRSNNGDRDKVLATVAFSVIQFLDHYPDAVIRITGQTIARTRLYQMGINKYLHEISLSYHVKGREKGHWEKFRTGKNYEMFILKKHQILKYEEGR
jgi:hypothetical protein